jgi:Protein of unknown function (DUF3455)
MTLRTSILYSWSVVVASAIIFGASASAPVTFAQDATMSTDMTPPPVPTALEVPAGNHVFRVGHAVGTQNYVCVSSDNGVKFVLFTPQATLFNDNQAQTETHYFSPNPFEAGTIRATWQDSADTSTVWGAARQTSTDPNFVAPDAIAWVLLQGVGAQNGPSGEGVLSRTSYIQRLNTAGGVAPSTGCGSASDIGQQAFVPYTADYFFYEPNAA